MLALIFQGNLLFAGPNEDKVVHKTCPMSPIASKASYATIIRHLRANVAQLVEQRTRNAQVSGSSPLVGSRKKRRSDPVSGLFFL